jgi:hypothetical protein
LNRNIKNGNQDDKSTLVLGLEEQALAAISPRELRGWVEDAAVFDDAVTIEAEDRRRAGADA